MRRPLRRGRAILRWLRGGRDPGSRGGSGRSQPLTARRSLRGSTPRRGHTSRARSACSAMCVLTVRPLAARVNAGATRRKMPDIGRGGDGARMGSRPAARPQRRGHCARPRPGPCTADAPPARRHAARGERRAGAHVRRGPVSSAGSTPRRGPHVTGTAREPAEKGFTVAVRRDAAT